MTRWGGRGSEVECTCACAHMCVCVHACVCICARLWAWLYVLCVCVLLLSVCICGLRGCLPWHHPPPLTPSPPPLLPARLQSADIWSAGVILYLMLSGELPFMAPTDRQVCAAVLHAPITLDGANWDAVSDGAKAVVRRMLCRDPARRAAPEELLSHPWLAGKEVVAAVEGAQALPAVKAGAVTGTCAGERQVVRQGMELQQRREE